MISAEKRFQHPHGNNLYLTCTNTEVFSSAAQVGAFYRGKQNLINLLLLVHAKSQDPAPHGNWKNIVHPKKFKKQFENQVVSPLSAMFSDGCLQTVAELAAMDIDTESKNIHVPLDILMGLRFLPMRRSTPSCSTRRARAAPRCCRCQSSRRSREDRGRVRRPSAVGGSGADGAGGGGGWGGGGGGGGESLSA